MKGPFTFDTMRNFPDKSVQCKLFDPDVQQRRGEGWLRAPGNGYRRTSDEAFVYTLDVALMLIEGDEELIRRTQFWMVDELEILQPASKLDISVVREKFDILKNQKCLIHHKDRGYWVSIPCEGHSRDRRRAVLVTVEQALHRKLTEGEHQIEIVPRVSFEVMAGAALVDMARNAPNNDMVRGQIMARFGCAPPKETMTFDQLKEWVETHTVLPEGTLTPVAISLQSVIVFPPFRTRLHFSDVERGTTNWRVNRVGQAHDVMTKDDLVDMIRNEDLSNIDELAEFLRSNAIEGGWDNDPTMQSTGEPMRYDEHEIQDHTDARVQVDESEEDTRTRLSGYMQQFFTAEELNELEFNPLIQEMDQEYEPEFDQEHGPDNE